MLGHLRNTSQAHILAYVSNTSLWVGEDCYTEVMPRPRVTRQRLGEYVGAAFLALFILCLAGAIWGVFHKEEVARQAVASTKNELATLQARREVLEKNIAELATPRGEEATLRQTYGVARPGEGVIIVVPSTVATSTAVLPWWRKVLGWFHL